MNETPGRFAMMLEKYSKAAMAWLPIRVPQSGADNEEGARPR